MKPSDQLAGGYDFLSTLARLMETDLDPLYVREQPEMHVRQMHATQVAGALSNWADVADVGLVATLPQETDRVLFHERIHYWQQIATPALQQRFRTHLAKLRLHVAELGGMPDEICDPMVAGDPETREGRNTLAREVEIRDWNAQAHWFGGSFDLEHIASPNPIDADTAMPFLLLPYEAGPEFRLPAYGAMMRSPQSGRVARIPFTALYLLESAAYVCERIFAGEGLPPRASLVDEEEDLYLGVWEFWRRVHADRYRDEASLALAFLAAVDFGLAAADAEVVMHGQFAEPDDDTRAELTSIPYRFGKFAYRAQGFPPLELGDREPADAIAEFQAGICTWTGLPSPEQTLTPVASLLTRMLLLAVSSHLDQSAVPAATELFSQPLTRRGEHLNAAWEVIRGPAVAATPKIGQDTVGEMLNATMLHLEHPGVLVAPHIYADRLRYEFPLPATLHHGRILIEAGAFNASSRELPYPRDPTRLVTDAIALTAIKPLLDRSVRCGFVTDGLDCAYVSWGLGCPQRGLTDSEIAVRQSTGIDDFCHWMHRLVVLRVAPDGAQEKWMDRIRDLAGRKPG